ncbi:MAG: dihydrofolate reductase [Spirochaetales bacterium]|nr:dihydrofolate reductase [Spirochaetales bacterium]
MTGLIVARSLNNVIGKNGQIPWKIDGEQKQFKELTTGNIVIMGRKTFEEIGHALPGRTTIVVSCSKKFKDEGLYTACSVEEAVQMAEKIVQESADNKNIFFAGGYNIYKAAIAFVDIMYITEIQTIIEDGDVFFPDFNKEDFEITESGSGGTDIKYLRKIYKRRKF